MSDSSVSEKKDLVREALQREKQRRKIAEDALETKTREVYQAHQQLQEKYDSLSQRSAEVEFLNSIAKFSMEEWDLRQALSLFTEEVCRLCRWPFGHVYLCDAEKLDRLKVSDIFYGNTNGGIGDFRKSIQSTQFGSGEGFIGKIFEEKKALTIDDLEKETFFGKDQLIQEKVKAVFGVPILVDDRVLAVVEFISQDVAGLRVTEIVKTGAIQLGMLIERSLSQKRLDRNYKKLKDTLEKLKDTQGQLVQSEKMASLGTIAAGVAHEVNNPIGFILSNVGTLSEYTDSLIKIIAAYEKLEKSTFVRVVQSDEGAKSTLEDVQKLKEEEDFEYIREDLPNLIKESVDGANRVKSIVQGLKTFSRVDEAEISDASINDCIESTLKVVWNELKYKCEIKKDLAILPTIRCYPGQLNQVFMNLFVNASHAIEKKGVIEIRSKRTDQEIVITVSDSGKGIPKDDLDKLFNPFFTTKPVGEGTGLGLSISYGIIEKHGGRIQVESEVGRGTVFTIYLPLSGIPNSEGGQSSEITKEVVNG